MTEETLFTAALEKDTKAERAAFLEAACAGDAALRRRVEALLESHEEADFLRTSAAERAAIAFGGEATAAMAESAAAGDPEPPLDFLSASEKPGTLGRLGHYEVLEVIGRGGMGVVLRAFDEKLHRVVAVKVMAPQLAASATARQWFLREARAAAAVTHDHVVTIHGVEEANGLPYIVMQFVDGVSLQDRIDRTGPLRLAEVLRIGAQAASSLAAAHAQGLVHRDVKPANILLENGVERVKITDFGLARAADDASLTQAGVVAGTPQYMSPEQAEGRPVDARSDLFSLGSVLYAMCAGRPPFRGSTARAVLWRVVEDAPPPVREVNPEIPDWLDDLIRRLHAKDPAGRFQSAAEVAEVLGQHLAHVQHPSVVPLPAAGPRPEAPRPRRHRWAVAATVLVAALAALGATEAAGLTQIRATVLRIFTPEGTLVVETDDPAVKVTVEGDGDLVITGAGPQEVRLKAGSYRLKATKDGKPVRLDRDLVTISRGDRQSVRVRLEGDAPAAVAPKAEGGAFVVLTGKGVEVRRFDTLAEAVQGASHGDTVEVRGNGPFVSEAIRIVNRALTIRAGEGYRPVIKLNPNLRTDAPLVLEGLELHRLDRKPPAEGYDEALVVSWGANSLHVANCRFFWQAEIQPCIVGDFPTCRLRNCEFLSSTNSTALFWSWYRGKLLLVENCLQLGRGLLQFGDDNGWPQPATSLRLRGNTLAGSAPGLLVWDVDKPRILAKTDLNRVSAEASTTIFDAPSVLLLNELGHFTASDRPIPAEQAEKLLLRGLDWRDDGNLYAPGSSTISRYIPESVTIGPQKLADWKEFWGAKNAKAIEGRVRYQGGDLHSKLRESPDRLTPEDFRLRADSAGYRAGKDGKDLGADVDLVGPGPAYERWKRTPEYQRWLKDTGQLRAEAPKPEPGAFVLLAPGMERKFDTLAEAVLGASDRDTIEIRGNGPFVTAPIHLEKTALTIRAGAGFRPVLLFAEGQLRTDAPLVLEGLELQRVGQKVPEGSLVFTWDSPSLRIANCRFREHLNLPCVLSNAPSCVLRNCEFLSPGHLALELDGKPCVIDNCLAAGLGLLVLDLEVRPDQPELSVRITRSTLRSSGPSLHVQLLPVQPDKFAEKDPKRVRIDASSTIFDATWVVLMNEVKPFLARLRPQPEDAKELLLRMLAWRDRGNLYALRGSLLWHESLPEGVAREIGPRSLADWKRLWASGDGDAVEGRVKYQGGDLLARLRAAPERLTPEDFRLRPDSSGYRAGKDLGADVDLVGPGPAYERWKRTPDYQQWLKDTGQVKQ